MVDFNAGREMANEMVGVHWREAQQAVAERSADFQRGFWANYRKRP